jgi:sensor histidine kinase YesM
MKHPLNGKALLIYFLVWVLIIAIHAGVLYNLFSFPVTMCVADAASFYMVLAGFGMSYYFAIRFFSSKTRITIQEIITHLAGVIIVVSLVAFLHDRIMRIWINNDDYLGYLQYSLGWRIASGVLLLLILVLIYYLYNHNQYLAIQQSRELDLQHMLRESEMEMLRFQINPHFIFNSLNSISALTMSAPETAQEMVIKLSEFFRNALGKERRDVHTLADELQQMALYLDIEQVRFGDRLRVRQDIPDRCLKHKLPALVLQPLYENAIKHGVYEQLDTVEIRTEVNCRDGLLEIYISNTYDPMQKTSAKGTGIGLKNVRSRLELMYGIPDLVTIERTRDMYRVKIVVPQTDDQDSDNR